MTDQQIIEAFLAWASLDRRRSPHTIRRYASVLASVGNAPSATREEIEQWWTSRLHTSAATRANAAAAGWARTKSPLITPPGSTSPS